MKRKKKSAKKENGKDYSLPTLIIAIIALLVQIAQFVLELFKD